MPKSIAVLALVCVMGLGPGCANESSTPERVRGYENATLGIQVAFPEGWSLFTARENAPPDLAGLFPADKGPDDSPLFIAWRDDRLAFARALVEPTDRNAVEYLELLLGAFEGQIEVLRAERSTALDAVRWIYRAPGSMGSIAFVEMILVDEGRAYRLGFWTLESRLERFEDEFDAIIERFRFLMGSAWSSRLAGALQALQPIPNVPLAMSRIPADEPIECAEGRRSLLWRVEAGESVVDLFGSFHLGRPSFYPLPDPVERAFDASDHLVVELDVSSASSAAEMERVMALGVLPDGQVLADVLDAEVYARLEAELAKLGVPVAIVERRRPFMVAMTLSVLKMQALGYVPDDGVELYLLRRRGERELIELESIEEQLALFEGFDPSLYLDYTLETLDQLDAEAQALAEDWYCGREEPLAKRILSVDSEQLEGVVQRVYDDRNVRMAERIEALLGEPGHYFVAVGAGHLVGDRGIPALLRARGLDVVRQ